MGEPANKHSGITKKGMPPPLFRKAARRKGFLFLVVEKKPRNGLKVLPECWI